MKSCLRKLDPERDGPALHAIFGDDRCCHYMTGPAFKTPEETIALLKRITAGTENTSWAIVEDAAGGALGRVSMIPRGDEIWEAAIMMAPNAQGKGLATRALGEAIDEIFEKHAARRIYADIDPDNAPCLRAFEKLGFQREGLLRGQWKTHIGVRDSVIMGLISSDPRSWKE